MIVAWLVRYGDRLQFKAYFDDRAKAEQYASTHGGQIVPLCQCKERES